MAKLSWAYLKIVSYKYNDYTLDVEVKQLIKNSI